MSDIEGDFKTLLQCFCSEAGSLNLSSCSGLSMMGTPVVILGNCFNEERQTIELPLVYLLPGGEGPEKRRLCALYTW